mmetsp:Transcript_18156/g.28155  ORF Transcript_18156/g.28155 Transcript_18156/m.28155 type:complete len:179 (-) Transcript_18156:2147-2683(-)
MRRVIYYAMALVGAAEAFIGTAPLACKCKSPSLRAGTCGQLKMVDWSAYDQPKQEEYTGSGADRGQMNKGDEINQRMQERLADSKAEVEQQGSGWASEYGHDLQEGDRDPHTGRLVLDPLKIPTAEQGAPASFAEYMVIVAFRAFYQPGSAAWISWDLGWRCLGRTLTMKLSRLCFRH